jgi:type IV secretion system protein VirD4
MESHELLHSERPFWTYLILPGAILTAAVTLPVLFTQRIVWHLGYDPILGPPLFYQIPMGLAGLTVLLAVFVGWMFYSYPLLRVFLFPLGLVCIAATYLAFLPFYHPLLGFHLFPNLLRGGPGTRGILMNSAFVTVVTVVLIVGTGIIFHNLLRRRGQAARIAHGSARYANFKDIRKAGLLKPGGIFLGTFRHGGRTHQLTDDSNHHTLFVMPSGAGKTAGHIIPSLLTRMHSAFVLDPKGELYNATAGWRASQGHRCIRLAPLDGAKSTLGPGERWNPLLEIEPGGDDIGALALLAEALITGEGVEESHWNESARSLFRCLALHSLYTGNPPTFRHIRALAHSTQGTTDQMQSILNAEHDPEGKFGWIDEEIHEPTRTHPEAALLARGFLDTPEKEMGSISSTLRRSLSIWGNQNLIQNTSTSDFDLGIFNRPEPVTLYVCVPYSDLHWLAPWIRILLASLVRRITRHRNVEEAPPLDLYLDEFASLGQVKVIHKILSFLRGYGVRTHIVIQSYDDLVRLYGKGENISACQIHVVAATQSLSSRRVISDLAGETTVSWERASHSGGRMQPLQPRENRTPMETRRPLITQGEVGTLGADEILIAKTGMPLIRARKRFYFKDGELAWRAGVRVG